MAPHRYTMYALLSFHNLINYCVRLALPSLIPAIALDAGLDEAATAMLLSSFFPGYLVTQLPGGWATQSWGGALPPPPTHYSGVGGGKGKAPAA